MQRRNHRSSWFIIGIVIAVFFTGESLSQENIDWKERFFAEAPKCWEDYVRFARCLQITRTVNRYRVVNRSSIANYTLELKQTKGACLLINPHPGSKGEIVVLGTNPAYSFELKRRSPDRGWIITDL